MFIAASRPAWFCSWNRRGVESSVFRKGTLRFVDLDARQINSALDAVTNSTDYVRTVIAFREDAGLRFVSRWPKVFARIRP